MVLADGCSVPVVLWLFPWSPAATLALAARAQRASPDRSSLQACRAGQGFGEDAEAELVADDVGISGGAASAEETAVHIIDDEE